MKLRLFTILSAFSLLLCAAAIVVWVRSHFVQDVLDCREYWTHPAGGGATEFHQRQTVVSATLGSLLCTSQHSVGTTSGNFRPLPRPLLDSPQLFVHHAPAAPARTAPGVQYVFNGMGFRFGTMTQNWQGAGGGTMRLAGGAVPLWAVASAFALPPAVWTVAALRRRRARGGFEVIEAERLSSESSGGHPVPNP